ncbi:phospholipase A-2-activating protein-like [Ipomoea triloba]|nr:phospholipase A-2-activating protein-like [Ipomoea triloba]
MIILHPDGANILLKHVNHDNDTLIELMKKVTVNPPLPANLLTSIRAVTNLFKNSLFYDWLIKNRGEILDAFSSCYLSSNKNVQLSYSTMVLNYAVLLIEKKDEEGQSQVLSAALEIAEEESVEADSKFRVLVAIGSLMLDGVVRRIALDFDVESIAKAAKAAKDPKLAEVGADIELIIKQT